MRGEHATSLAIGVGHFIKSVTEELQRGRTVRSVYEEMKPRFPAGYAQFAKYVQRSVAPTEVRKTAAGQASCAGRSVAAPQIPLTSRTGPPKGRPEDAIPTVDMDRFAAQALKNKDLF